jgi:hypothetical protein
MKKTIASIAIVGLSVVLATPSNAAVTPGSKCSKVSQTSIVDNIKYTCVKSGSKLVWNKGSKVSVVQKVKESLWDTQATSMAKRYLDVSAFSYNGLIDQLVIGSGFTKEQATNAVTSLNVNWNEQALRMAKKYLEVSSFSKEGLIDQLVIGSQFTQSQAEYAVNNI